MTTAAARRATTGRGRFPARTLHVVDVENLVGTAFPHVAEVATIRATYLVCVPLLRHDQVVVACSHLALIDVGVGWGCHAAQYRVRSGPDGADLALLELLDHEQVAERFTGVVIGSGDGAFAAAAARLAARGCRVTVVSRRESLSARLALAAHEVHYLDTVESAVAAGLSHHADAA